MAQGDSVFGGTSNLTGVMDIRVTKAGHDATLGRVKDLILQAQHTRIPIMRMIDSYATWYTPTVLMLVGVVLFLTLDRAAGQSVAAGDFDVGRCLSVRFDLGHAHGHGGGTVFSGPVGCLGQVRGGS